MSVKPKQYCLFLFFFFTLTATSQTEDFKTDTVKLNGIKFTYIEKGKGPLVIAFHGFPDLPTTFHYQIAALASAGYRVVAPYMRGYYPTDTAADNCYHSACLIRDAVALVNHFLPSRDKAILIGHDWGAVAAYGAAILLPEKVSHLVTLAVPKTGFSTALVTNPAQQRRSWYMFYFQMPFAETAVSYNQFAFIDRLWSDWSPQWNLPKEHLNNIKATFSKPGVLTAVLNYYRHTFGNYQLNPALLPQAKRYSEPIKVTSMYIHGETDGAVGVEAIDGVEKAYGGQFEKNIVKNAGHFVHLEKPEEVNKLILAFLKK